VCFGGAAQEAAKQQNSRARNRHGCVCISKKDRLTPVCLSVCLSV
jgi:hypothetical protein